MCKDIQAAFETHRAIENELLEITKSLTEISFILASSPICETKRKAYLDIMQDHTTPLGKTASAMTSLYIFFFKGFDLEKDKEREDYINALSKDGIAKIKLTQSLNKLRKLAFG